MNYSFSDKALLNQYIFQLFQVQSDHFHQFVLIIVFSNLLS
nr:MAG TPA: hypothetical protein [Caudoviricetes sp.]